MGWTLGYKLIYGLDPEYKLIYGLDPEYKLIYGLDHRELTSLWAGFWGIN
jgi:hypothetical protein